MIDHQLEFGCNSQSQTQKSVTCLAVCIILFMFMIPEDNNVFGNIFTSKTGEKSQQIKRINQSESIVATTGSSDQSFRSAGPSDYDGNKTKESDFAGLYNLSCDRARRCGPLDATSSVSFIHISKCAGASWIVDLRTKLLRVFPKAEAGPEYSISYTKRLQPDATYILTSLRHPRRHIWSLFTECKYDAWGKHTTNHTAFPNDNASHSNVPNPNTDLVDFSAWLDHFLDDSGAISTTVRTKAGCFKCYHPANYQSRAFVSQQESPHCVMSSIDFAMEWSKVQQQYWQELDWVAIADFFHESKCLLYYRFLLGSTNVSWAEDYLNEYCVCPHPVLSQNDTITHHAEGHRSHFSDLPRDVLDRIQTLTKTDTRLYRAALLQFLNEMAWLEAGLGRRILCDAALRPMEVELEYVGLGNITSLYHEIIARHG